MSQTVNYEEKPVTQMLYSKTPKLIKGVEERRTEQYRPRAAVGGYVAGNIVEFDLLSDNLLDLQSFSVQFELDITSDTAANSYLVQIANAVDLFESIQVYYNDVECDKVDDCNAWSNQFLLYNVNKSFLEGDGSIYMGINNQVFTSLGGHFPEPSAGVFRTYSIPLSFLSGFFAMHNYLPMMGNRLRLKFTLAPMLKVLSRVSSMNDTYTCNAIVLKGDTVIPKREYRNEILREMSSSDGFRMSYLSYFTSKQNVSNASTQNIRLTYNLSNALSLHMIRDVTKAQAATIHTLACQTFPLSEFSNLKVKSGSLWFTDPSGINSFVELYNSVQKTMGPIGNIDGAGVVNWKTYTGAYAKNAIALNGTYGNCLMSVNLEKALMPDNDATVLNSGISSTAKGASNQFDIELQTSAPLNNTDSLLINIVHRRNLVFKDSAWTVEV